MRKKKNWFWFYERHFQISFLFFSKSIFLCLNQNIFKIKKKQKKKAKKKNNQKKCFLSLFFSFFYSFFLCIQAHWKGLVFLFLWGFKWFSNCPKKILFTKKIHAQLLFYDRSDPNLETGKVSESKFLHILFKC